MTLADAPELELRLVAIQLLDGIVEPFLGVDAGFMWQRAVDLAGPTLFLECGENQLLVPRGRAKFFP